LEPGTLKLCDTTYFLNYAVMQHDVASMEKGIVNGVANGGICGDDMCVIECSEQFVDVSGVSGHGLAHFVVLLHRHWYQFTREMLL
jgi:hypothetical protein